MKLIRKKMKAMKIVRRRMRSRTRNDVGEENEKESRREKRRV